MSARVNKVGLFGLHSSLQVILAPLVRESNTLDTILPVDISYYLDHLLSHISARYGPPVIAPSLSGHDLAATPAHRDAMNRHSFVLPSVRRQGVGRATFPRTDGKADRFIQTALREWAYAKRWDDSEQRDACLRPRTDYYDLERLHGSLNYKLPISRSDTGLPLDHLQAPMVVHGTLIPSKADRRSR